MSDVSEYVHSGELQRLRTTVRTFKSYSEAIGFAGRINPEELALTTLYEGGMGLPTKVCGYRLQYVGSEGMM